jgi:hypothetical protein
MDKSKYQYTKGGWNEILRSTEGETRKENKKWKNYTEFKDNTLGDKEIKTE